MRSRKRRLAAIALVLVLGVLAALAPIRPANAASKVRLSKTSLTFKSDKAKAQTITVKGIKKSNIKEMTIQNYAETYISVKQKGKNKIVVKPLRSSDDITSPIYVTVEFKKPIKGDYRAYLSVEKLKVKGKSKIAVKTADELASLLPHCTRNRWTYYLANDIDMTGRGFINYSYADLNIDGKGHKIISDGPVFGEFSGKMKNVIFECNYDIAPSKNSIVNELLSSYKEIAPVLQLETGSTMTGCKSTGTIKINFDEDLEDSNITVAGLLGTNDYTSKVVGCKSEVDISITGADKYKIHALWVGGIVATNNNNAELRESEFAGKITVDYNWPSVGGICQFNDTAGKIYDCLMTGAVNSGQDYPCAAIVANGSGEFCLVERVLSIGSADAQIFSRVVDEDDVENKQLPAFKDVYYLTSKADAVKYRDKAFEIPGVHGITETELLAQATFEGFDFTKVWEMGANGPKLRNVID